MAKKNDLVVSIIGACGGFGAVAEAASVEEGRRREQGFVRAWPTAGAIPTRYNTMLRQLGGEEVRQMLLELNDLQATKQARK